MTEADEYGPGGEYSDGPNTEYDRPENPERSIREIRKAIEEVTEMMKELVRDPSIIDGWTPVERAWMKEHIELLNEQARGAQEDIRKLLGR